MKDYKEIKERLNKISPTFCVAKWNQVTMHLESGLTHSCHHPKAHTVPLDELKNNISALHNTNFKKQIRKDMLEGKFIKECDYCNRVEKNSKYTLSDRVYKSSEPWAEPFIEEISKRDWNENTFPTYFEVSFSSLCSCSCMYCSPTFSSKWTEEIKKYGGYPSKYATKSLQETPPPKYLNIDNNPYITAFWKWWPELYNNLQHFRITGGEPLLHKDTFKILDYMIENPKPDLFFSINSNFSIKPKIFHKFIEKFKRVNEKNKNLNVYTSCEAKGEKANYIRHGMDYNYFLDNCRTYLEEIHEGSLTFMCTYNILSITSFKEFLKDILQLKQEFPMRVKIDIPFLMNPPYLQSKITTMDFLKIIEDSVTFMYSNIDVPRWFPLVGKKFWPHEIAKLKRIYFIVAEGQKENHLKLKKNFILFIDEYDRRHNTNFLKVFPEYKDFYFHCKEL